MHVLVVSVGFFRLFGERAQVERDLRLFSVREDSWREENVTKCRFGLSPPEFQTSLVLVLRDMQLPGFT